MKKSQQQLNVNLSIACFLNDKRTVEELLECDADIHYENDVPLFNAVHTGSLAIVKLLIERGANVNNLCGNNFIEFKNKTILEFSKHCNTKDGAPADVGEWSKIYDYLKIKQRKEKIESMLNV